MCKKPLKINIYKLIRTLSLWLTHQAPKRSPSYSTLSMCPIHLENKIDFNQSESSLTINATGIDLFSYQSKFILS